MTPSCLAAATHRQMQSWKNRLGIAAHQIKSPPDKCCAARTTGAGGGTQIVISSQGQVADRFICFSFQRRYVARPLGHQLILGLCSEGSCANLVSPADKGIHLAANPLSDSHQVSAAAPFRSKYLVCLISKILPA